MHLSVVFEHGKELDFCEGERAEHGHPARIQQRAGAGAGIKVTGHSKVTGWHQVTGDSMELGLMLN